MIRWEDIKAVPGDRILPKWNALVSKAEERKVLAGKGTRMQTLPNGVAVSAEPVSKVVRHPWRMGSPDDEDTVVMRVGTVSGHRPFITEDLRIGDEDPETGEAVRLKLKPKDEGFSYIMVGVNVRNTDGDRAELPTETESLTWDMLRLAERDTLSKGFGSGGVLEDQDGWAWYPLVYIEWDGKLMSAQFQIVMHSLGHLIVADSEGNARHFFPPF